MPGAGHLAQRVLPVAGSPAQRQGATGRRRGGHLPGQSRQLCRPRIVRQLRAQGRPVIAERVRRSLQRQGLRPGLQATVSRHDGLDT